MSFADFADLCADEVSVEPFALQDSYGKNVYGQAWTTRARVELGPVLITNATGQEVVSHARVYVGRAVGIRDRITVPADAGLSQTPQILRVAPVRDESGIHHYQIYV